MIKYTLSFDIEESDKRKQRLIIAIDKYNKAKEEVNDAKKSFLDVSSLITTTEDK